MHRRVPNLFNVAGVGNTAVLTNGIVAIEHHVDWIGACIGWLDAAGHTTTEADPAAEAAWGAHVDAVARQTVFLGCNSWYCGANIPGKPSVFMPFVGGFLAYAERCAAAAARRYKGFMVG